MERAIGIIKILAKSLVTVTDPVIRVMFVILSVLCTIAIVESLSFVIRAHFGHYMGFVVWMIAQIVLWAAWYKCFKIYHHRTSEGAMNHILEIIDVLLRIMMLLTSFLAVLAVFTGMVFLSLIYVVPHTGIVVGVAMALFAGLFLVAAWMKFLEFMMLYHNRYLYKK